VIETPLVPSRSLGKLLGLQALAFKLEAVQPTGSWLDRDAAGLVARAAEIGLSGVCLVESGPLALPLAVQCARAGRTLVVLSPAGPDQQSAGADGWLAALGARVVVVDAGPADLLLAAPSIAERAGLLLVDGGPGSLVGGLAAVSAEIAAAGHRGSVLAVPSLTGHEATLLEAARSLAVVGSLSVGGVSLRESDAARVLLAREEGLIVSEAGATGLAA
jgi:threonine synthase